jgi:hypothetical protein
MRVLRGVAGRVLDCGCLVGVYETYAGEVVTIIDARGEQCTDPAHRERGVVGPAARKAPADAPPKGRLQ